MILNLTELSSEPLHSQISRQLRAKILAGAVNEGAELPPVHAFARRQRVSAISVQRAYQDLIAEGLLLPLDAQDPKSGVRVATVSEERRRDMEQQRLLETLREQEFSVKELELARDIQCRLLPPPRVEGRGFTVVAHNEPARFVAGDFYDVLRPGDGSIGLVVADVAGKGIGPSLLMASVKAVLPYIAADRGVRDTLSELNRRLRKELGRREFVALALARFEPATGRLEIGNAGLPDPYLLPAGGDARSVDVPGERLPLGLRADVDYGSVELEMNLGDRLFLLSDGLPEAEDGDGEPFGYERFEAHLRACPSHGDPETWLEGCLDGLRQRTGPLRRDDWTALLLESTQAPEIPQERTRDESRSAPP